MRAAAKRCVSRYEPDASTKTRKDKRNEIIIVVSPAVTSTGGDNGHNAVCAAASPDYAAHIYTIYSEAFNATGLVETHIHTHISYKYYNIIRRTHAHKVRTRHYKCIYI